MDHDTENTRSPEIQSALQLITAGRTDEAKKKLETLVESDSALPNHLKLEAYGHLIRLAGECRDLAKVPDYINAIKSIPIESSVEKGRFAECLYSIGVGWLYLGSLEKAAKNLAESAKLAEEIENKKLGFYIKIAQLELLRHQGRYKDILAELDVMEQDPILKTSMSAAGSCAIMRGDVLRKQGYYREALGAYERAREIYSRNKNSPFFHYSLWALGTCYAALEDKQKAVIYLELASHNSQSIEFWRINILANLTLAELYTISGDYDKADSIYKKVVEQVGTDENTYYGKRLLRGMAFCHARRGEYAQADEILDRLVVIALRDQNNNEIMRLRLLKAEVLIRNGDAQQFEEARKMLEEALAFYSERNILRHKAVALELLARLDSFQGFHQEALKKVVETAEIAKASSFDRLFIRATLARMVILRRMGQSVGSAEREQVQSLINNLNAAAERVVLARFNYETLEEWSQELRQLDDHAQRFVNEFFEDFHYVPSQSVDMEIDKNSNYVREKHLGEIPFHNKFTLMRILLLLAEKPGREFSKEELAQEIWGQEYNPLRHDNNIYININRLRKLLEPNPRESRYVMNGSKGYYFNPLMKVNISSKISTVAPRSQGLVAKELGPN